uniref:Hemogen n=1 Tax=Sciurus vulgaris TaxID=55149 RepID=A0A8D2JPR0_SCIVU
MDSGKEQSHLNLHQTPDLHPDVIGTWSLRNREQLRKRKAEAQEKQISQWLLGEQKKRKQQKTGRQNQRGRKRQQNAERKAKPWSRRENNTMEEALAPTERETEPPGAVAEALPLAVFPRRAVTEGHSSQIRQESIIHQENSSEYQETVVQNHHSETGHMAAPETLSPKTCQETAALPDHCSEACQEMAEPEVLTPKTCQEIAILHDHPLKMWQEITQPRVLSLEMCQETAGIQALPSTSEYVADLEGCSPEASPNPDVPNSYPLDTYRNTAGLEEFNSEPDQATAEAKGFFPKIQDIAVPKDLSTKTCQERVEPEYFSHETHTEISVLPTSSPETIQETPAPEECSPDIYEETPGPGGYSPDTYQETPEPGEYSPDIPGPEDLSTKTYRNKDMPIQCLPEPNGETSWPQGQDPEAYQEDAEHVNTFPQEVKEKPKVEEPEIPAIPRVPQEIHPENDVYSYVLF